MRSAAQTESVSQTAPMSSGEDPKSYIEYFITSFTDEIGYVPTATADNDGLWKGMCQYADKAGIAYEKGSHSWESFRVGYMYPLVCFPNHPLEVQTYIGIYTWLGILLDDETAHCLDDIQTFYIRFYNGERQSNLLLQGWADLMKLSFNYWDPQVASFIISASLNFLNANALEARNKSATVKRTKAGRNWAWFIREKDGAGEAYAWFTFPKALCPDITLFMEVIPDLGSWIGLVNDILSFWKEEKAGERYNYIQNTSWYEDKDARIVFADINDNVKLRTRNMRLVLQGRDPYLELMDTHLLGYISLHKLTRRYRLWEVGLGEYPPSVKDRT
ncbi:unnamed protein product [Fusarium graminearum]|uniref:Trichodiene synthase n=1 Tax=Gibberella zeae TaxID=5518 RepID=A0A4E9EIQ9_GIBZA|nr:unnamed protein product [Fusarium graminearum]